MRGRTAWKLRAAALGLAAFGAVTNLAVATHLLSFSRVLKWESDSEWESSAQEWRIDSIKLVWALMAAYFVTATVACLVGVVGVVKVRLGFFVSQYSIRCILTYIPLHYTLLHSAHRPSFAYSATTL